MSRFWKFSAIATTVVVLLILAQAFDLQGLLRLTLIGIDSLGIFAPLAFITLYNAATLLLVPGSILTLGGGVLFGLIWGVVYVLCAAILGSTLAFFIGRYFSQGWLYRRVSHYPKFQAINTAVSKEGFKIVFLIRLSPILPFNLLNYAFGLTQVSLQDYLLGSLGIIPGTMMYVYLGSFAGDLAQLGTTQVPLSPEVRLIQGIVQGLGLVATMIVTLYSTHVARQVLAEKIHPDQK